MAFRRFLVKTPSKQCENIFLSHTAAIRETTILCVEAPSLHVHYSHKSGGQMTMSKEHCGIILTRETRSIC